MRREDLEWVERGISKGLSRLEMGLKLKKAGFSEEQIEAFEEEYDRLFDVHLEEQQTNVQEDESLREKVIKYNKGEEMSRRDMKEVERFSKDVKKYLKIWKSATQDIQKAFERIEGSNIKDIEKTKEEVENLRGEIIDRLLESRVLLEIEDPNTNLGITKESLGNCTTKQLIKLMEDNVEEMESFINGKTSKLENIDKIEGEREVENEGKRK